jgi:hypothetical protein
MKILYLSIILQCDIRSIQDSGEFVFLPVSYNVQSGMWVTAYQSIK